MAVLKRVLPLLTILCLTTSSLWAAPKNQPAKLNVAQNIQTNLKNNEGHYVIIKLKSGDTISGTVGAVAGGMVQLKEVKDISYFDALVSISEIAAIAMQVKGFR